MDLDLSFLSAVIRQERGYFTAKRNGIAIKMLEGSAIQGWKFIEDHVLRFGTIPSEAFFSAKTQIDLIDVSDKVESLVREIRERALWNKLRGTHQEMSDFLADRRASDAMKVMQDAVHKSYRDGLVGSGVDNLLSMGPSIIEHYDRMKNGERGIKTPWPAMDDMTLGWWGGDLVIFVARMGVGKTFGMLMLAREAWMDGKRILFVGTEMERKKLALRFYAIHLKLPYHDFKRGQLGAQQEKRMKESILQLSKEEGLDVVGDDFDAEIGEIESAVEQVRPDVLFVDGLYLVKNESRNRHERVSNTADDLKRLAKRHGIPVVASTQFNRDVTSNSKTAVNAQNIGITDVIGWNSDVIFGMYQTEDMREDNIMGFRPMKLREGNGDDFFCRWNFDTMTFTQEDISSDSDFKPGDYGGVAVGTDGGWNDDSSEDSLF